MPNPWLRIGFDAWALAFEASTVVYLRALRIATGGTAATRETQRMVGEKIEAGIALQTRALTGGLGPTMHGAVAKSLTHYRRKVRANRRRLRRP